MPNGRPPDTRRPDGLRDAARAQALAGRALSLEGRTTEAQDRLSAAVQVLRPEPDRDTVRVLAFLGGLAAMTGSGDADSLTSEALRLGQALDVDDGQLGRLFSNRGLFLGTDNRPAEAIASFEYAARVAERSGNSNGTAVALSNLSDMLLGIDPHAAADAARAVVRPRSPDRGPIGARLRSRQSVDRVDPDRGLGRRAKPHWPPRPTPTASTMSTSIPSPAASWPHSAETSLRRNSGRCCPGCAPAKTPRTARRAPCSTR